jgi:hypothetical protein
MRARRKKRTEMPAQLPPIRALTSGPKYHWFGYYDHLQLDPAQRYVLGAEVGFEHRLPQADDVIKVGMIDLRDNDRWIELGESRTWNWQQTCMLQWRPGSASEVVWNDRQGDHFVCHILDVRTRTQRTWPFPVYALAPDGKTGIVLDFRRLFETRPDTGYAGLADPYGHDAAPRETGIWSVNLDSGEQSLIVPFSRMLDLPGAGGDGRDAKHRYEHLLWNPAGTRFIFLHRWSGPGLKGLPTSLLTANADGSDIHVLEDSGRVSHFIWRDDTHILCWANHAPDGEAFYLYDDEGDQVDVVGKDVMTCDGHCSYLPGAEWILNDTYPDTERRQHLYLYHVKTNTRLPLGAFYTAPAYSGVWRCDLHPRYSANGRMVTIDSNHEGNGRQIYLLDISDIVQACSS